MRYGCTGAFSPRTRKAVTLSRGSDKGLTRMVLAGGAWLIGGRFVRTAITLLGIAVLARILTPADFGIVAVATIALTLSVALLEGLIDVPAIREDDLDREGLANLIWTGLGLMAIVVAAIWLAAPFLEGAVNAPGLAPVIRLVSLGLFAQPFIVAGTAVLRRNHRFPAVARFLLVTATLYVATAIGLALAGWGVWSLAVGQLVSLLGTAASMAYSARTPVLPPRRMRPMAALRLGGLASAARLLAWTGANVDTLFASIALGPAGAGFYSRAYNIVTQVKEPFGAVDHAIRQAFVARRTVAEDVQTAGNLRGLRLVTLISALTAGGLVVMREPIVAILLGDQWLPVIPALAVLAASLPARIARIYLDSLTYVQGSIAFMLARNAAIAGALIAGLAMFAERGVTAIAVVVGVAHYLSLLITTGNQNTRQSSGSLVQQGRAMAPALLIAGLIVAAIEGASALADFPDLAVDAVLRAGLFGALAMIVAAAIPAAWLGQTLACWRRRRLGR